MSTYEDMAGAILVLFLFGTLLLFVSLSLIILTGSVLLTSLLFVLIARHLPVWKHLWGRYHWVRVHLLVDKSTDQERRLCGAVLNNQHSGLLVAPFLQSSSRFLLFQSADDCRHSILHVHYHLVHCHCHPLLRE